MAFPDAQNYILTSIDTANKDGCTLFAVVYRPSSSIAVVDKYDNKTLRRFSSEDRLFYELFETTATGTKLDVIVDWAGVPVDYHKTQKQQAAMMTLAADAVVEGRRRNDYWEAERRWIKGEYLDVIKSQNEKVQKALKL